MTTAEYYREIRRLLWPVLGPRLSAKEPLSLQMGQRSRAEVKVAKALLRLPAGDSPAKLVRHVEAWAKHLQAGQEHYEQAEALGLYDPAGGDDEDGRPGLIGKIVGTIFAVAAPATLDAIDKADRRKAVQLSTQIAAYQKRERKWRDERDRLEAILEQIGADCVPNFSRREHFRLQRCVGEERLLPEKFLIEPNLGIIEDQLRSLPGGDQLSNIEIYPHSGEYLVVIGAAGEDFALAHVDRDTDEVMKSVREDFPVPEALDLANRYCDSPEEWEELVDWEKAN